MHSKFDLLVTLAKTHRNVLLISDHGIGKTTMGQKIAEMTGLKFGYYSASTMDPFSDFVGIPFVRQDENEHEYVKFVRPRRIDEEEFVFFDELNRALPKTLNAVYEMIQFGTLNGEPLPKLKMVWAAINSHVSGKYQGVSSLDQPLMDRFHAHVELDPEPSVEYYESVGIEPRIGEAVVNWWDAQTDEVKWYLTPRRLEMIGNYLMEGMDPALAKPHGVNVSFLSLKSMLRTSGKSTSTLKPTDLIDKKTRQTVLKGMENDHAAQLEAARCLQNMDTTEIADCLDVVSAMFDEVQFEFFRQVETKLRKDYKELNNEVSLPRPIDQQLFDMAAKSLGTTFGEEDIPF